MVSLAEENSAKKGTGVTQNQDTENAVSNEEIYKLIKEIEKTNLGKEDLYKTLLDMKNEKIGMLQGNISNILAWTAVLIGLIGLIIAVIGIYINYRIKKVFTKIDVLYKETNVVSDKIISTSNKWEQILDDTQKRQQQIEQFINSRDFDQQIKKLGDAYDELQLFKNKIEKEYKLKNIQDLRDIIIKDFSILNENKKEGNLIPTLLEELKTLNQEYMDIILSSTLIGGNKNETDGYLLNFQDKFVELAKKIRIVRYLNLYGNNGGVLTDEEIRNMALDSLKGYIEFI